MTIDDFDGVKLLLDNLSDVQLKSKFNFLIRVIKEVETESEKILIMDVLAELADRQWETYDLLPEQTRLGLGESITDVWDRDSLDSTEKLVGIVAKLGLGNTFLYLTEIVNEILNPEVKQEIRSAITEFGENVNDPYSGMR